MLDNRTFFWVCCSIFSQLSYAQATKDPETRIKELGIQLRTPDALTGSFIGAVRVGNIVYLSGQGPLKADGKFMIGKVGSVFNSP